jgi:hypothetical protein
MGIKVEKCIVAECKDFSLSVTMILDNYQIKKAKEFDYFYMSEQGPVKGVIQGDRFQVTDFNIGSEGSYKAYTDLRDMSCTSRGNLELILVWDDRETIDHIKITNGEYFEENLNLEVALRSYVLHEYRSGA